MCSVFCGLPSAPGLGMLAVLAALVTAWVLYQINMLGWSAEGLSPVLYFQLLFCLHESVTEKFWHLYCVLSSFSLACVLACTMELDISVIGSLRRIDWSFNWIMRFVLPPHLTPLILLLEIKNLTLRTFNPWIWKEFLLVVILSQHIKMPRVTSLRIHISRNVYKRFGRRFSWHSSLNWFRNVSVHPSFISPGSECGGYNRNLQICKVNYFN